MPERCCLVEGRDYQNIRARAWSISEMTTKAEVSAVRHVEEKFAKREREVVHKNEVAELQGLAKQKSFLALRKRDTG